jgi:hypothetical protein
MVRETRSSGEDDKGILFKLTVAAVEPMTRTPKTATEQRWQHKPQRGKAIKATNN